MKFHSYVAVLVFVFVEEVCASFTLLIVFRCCGRAVVLSEQSLYGRSAEGECEGGGGE